MMDNDYSAIPPVENLQNVAALTPTGQRPDQRRRPGAGRRDRKSAEAAPSPGADGPTERRDDTHAVDYCA